MDGGPSLLLCPTLPKLHSLFTNSPQILHIFVLSWVWRLERAIEDDREVAIWTRRVQAK